MRNLDDPRWKELDGGYRLQYDVSVTLRKFRDGAACDEIWPELWDNLHHQGDIGLASLAAVPHLVAISASRPNRDWNLYALVSTIELERARGANPDLPEWLEGDYREAWERLFNLGLEDLRRCDDPLVIRSILGVSAIHRGCRKLGEILTMFDESEFDEIYNEFH